MSLTVETSARSPAEAEPAPDLLLTRQQASAYLATLNVKLAPTTLAWLWSRRRKGPPCEHIRGKPWYPQSALRRWAAEQRSGVRSSPDEPGSPLLDGAAP